MYIKSNILILTIMLVTASCYKSSTQSSLLSSESIDLIYPTDKLECSSQDINFQWSQVETTAVDYTLRIYDNYPDKQQYREYTPIRENNYKLSLVPSKAYYYDVQASDGIATITSELYSFSTESQAISDHLPQAVTYNNPINGITLDQSEVILQWSSVDNDNDTLYYDLYLGETSNNLSRVLSSTQESSYELSDLKSNTTYYWKVNVKDNKSNFIMSQKLMQFKIK